MTLYEATLERHSLRQYLDTPLTDVQIAVLNEAIASVNGETGLHIQLVTNEPKAFQSKMAKYGKFSGVNNYIVMAGKPSRDFEETVGYYGEKLVLLAQTSGLNTCWVGLTYQKVDGAFSLEKGEKIACVISLGIGATQGVQSKSKTATEVSNISDVCPKWFRKGVECALNAPTAVNQQKFFFEYIGGDKVKASTRLSLVGYTKIDLGIAKLHFELGAQSAGKATVDFI